MGRKTYETIGRPLPGRTNIVMTHDRAYQAPGCEVVHSFEEALSLAGESNPSEVFVIGGSVIFNVSIDQADKLYLTEVHGKPEGDILFTYRSSDWQEIAREDHQADEENQYAYSFVTLVRKKNDYFV